MSNNISGGLGRMFERGWYWTGVPMSLWTGCRPVAFNAVLPYIDTKEISGNFLQHSRPRYPHIRIMADVRAEHRTHDGHPYRIRPDVL